MHRDDTNRTGPTSNTEWRCRSCRLLLGVNHRGCVEVRLKGARYLIEGAISAVCRRCGDTSTFGAPPRAVATL